MIIARTDALAVNGLDDAIERARRYAAVGADVLFVDAPRDERDLEAIAGADLGAPLIVNVSEHGRTPDLGVARFAELGFRIVLYPSSTLFAAPARPSTWPAACARTARPARWWSGCCRSRS